MRDFMCIAFNVLIVAGGYFAVAYLCWTILGD